MALKRLFSQVGPSAGIPSMLPMVDRMFTGGEAVAEEVALEAEQYAAQLAVPSEAVLGAVYARLMRRVAEKGLAYLPSECAPGLLPGLCCMKQTARAHVGRCFRCLSRLLAFPSGLLILLVCLWLAMDSACLRLLCCCLPGVWFFLACCCFTWCLVLSALLLVLSSLLFFIWCLFRVMTSACLGENSSDSRTKETNAKSPNTHARTLTRMPRLTDRRT